MVVSSLETGETAFIRMRGARATELIVTEMRMKCGLYFSRRANAYTHHNTKLTIAFVPQPVDAPVIAAHAIGEGMRS